MQQSCSISLQCKLAVYCRKRQPPPMPWPVKFPFHHARWENKTIGLFQIFAYLAWFLTGGPQQQPIWSILEFIQQQRWGNDRMHIRFLVDYAVPLVVPYKPGHPCDSKQSEASRDLWVFIRYPAIDCAWNRDLKVMNCLGYLELKSGVKLFRLKITFYHRPSPYIRIGLKVSVILLFISCTFSFSNLQPITTHRNRSRC